MKSASRAARLRGHGHQFTVISGSRRGRLMAEPVVVELDLPSATFLYTASGLEQLSHGGT